MEGSARDMCTLDAIFANNNCFGCFFFQWLKLEAVKSGQIHIRTEWVTLSANPADLERVLCQKIVTITFDTVYCRNAVYQNPKVQTPVIATLGFPIMTCSIVTSG